MSAAGEIAGNATMRAAFFAEPGPAEAVEVGELPVPVPGPTDVLVAVEVAVINPVDTLIRSGRWPTLTPLPFVTGRDLAGTVAAAGPGSRFSPGDRVWSASLGHDGRQGSCAQYAVVPATGSTRCRTATGLRRPPPRSTPPPPRKPSTSTWPAAPSPRRAPPSCRWTRPPKHTHWSNPATHPGPSSRSARNHELAHQPPAAWTRHLHRAKTRDPDPASLPGWAVSPR
jgi:hypothetical protein